MDISKINLFQDNKVTNIEDCLIPLDNAIDHLFSLAITEGHRCSPLERRLLALLVFGALRWTRHPYAKQESKNATKVSSTHIVS